jgi:Ca-activated chloride channel family protein
MLEFAHPWVLLLAPALVTLLLLARRRPRVRAALRHPSLALLPTAAGGWRIRAGRILFGLRLAALVLVVLALARPRLAHSTREVEGDGIDIVVALDISGSMRALDFQPQDRLGVAKQVIREFVTQRPTDRIGLVVFASRAFTQCPLTVDRTVLLGFLDEVQVGLIEDGTAIGLGLATATNRLKQSTALSRTVILLTDGLNNVPTLEPATAAELARALGVRVYTVGVGREGSAPYPVDDPLLGRRLTRIETHIDEALLRRIAATTGGEYFRAEDPEALRAIFATIDRLEKSRYQTTVSTNYRELMAVCGVPALMLLLLEAALGATLLRRLP